MREQEIEMQLVRAVKKMGGRAVKFTSPGFDGMPDRLVLLPGGKCGFVEVKAPGKKPRALQLVRHEMLKALGFKAYVLDAIGHIEEIINDIQSA
ncbi:MAG: VRR-NUC domain-containing protein [Sphaerochaeta sp.]